MPRAAGETREGSQPRSRRIARRQRQRRQRGKGPPGERGGGGGFGTGWGDRVSGRIPRGGNGQGLRGSLRDSGRQRLYVVYDVASLYVIEFTAVQQVPNEVNVKRGKTNKLHTTIEFTFAAEALPVEPLSKPAPTAGAAAAAVEAATWDSEGGAAPIAMEGGADSGTAADATGEAATRAA